MALGQDQGVLVPVRERDRLLQPAAVGALGPVRGRRRLHGHDRWLDAALKEDGRVRVGHAVDRGLERRLAVAHAGQG